MKSSPALSHRDHVLLQKEQRRREEEQRFEEEAQKIREENLAFQRNLHGSKDKFYRDDQGRGHVPGPLPGPPRSGRNPSPPPPDPIPAFMAASTTHGIHDPGHPDPPRPALPVQPRAVQPSPGLEYLLEYEHITPLNLANPFQSGGGGLVHSPKVRDRQERHRQ